MIYRLLVPLLLALLGSGCITGWFLGGGLYDGQEDGTIASKYPTESDASGSLIFAGITGTFSKPNTTQEPAGLQPVPLPQPERSDAGSEVESLQAEVNALRAQLREQGQMLEGAERVFREMAGDIDNLRRALKDSQAAGRRIQAQNVELTKELESEKDPIAEILTGAGSMGSVGLLWVLYEIRRRRRDTDGRP